MLSRFDRTTPIIDLGANSYPLRWGSRRWLLWPVHAFKLLIPVARTRHLNVFQRATLDLCRAGVRWPEQISTRLALPEDLVTFLFAQLQSMDLLTPDCSPTTRALRLLDEDDEPPEIEEVAWVFGDGLSGRLWPRMRRGELPLIDCEDLPDKKDVVRLSRGNPGHPRFDNARYVWPDARAPIGAPSSREVIKAARSHRRRAKAFQQEWAKANPDAIDPGMLARQGVRVLSRLGEPYFVAVCLFVPDDVGQRTWLMTDPCGLGVTDVLRPTMNDLAQRNQQGIRGLIERLTGEAWQVDESELAQVLGAAARDAGDRIRQRLGAAVDLLPIEALGHLADAEDAISRARDSGPDMAKALEGAYSNGQAALESVFGWLVDLYPDPDLLAALTPDPEYNADLCVDIAAVLGFETPGEVRSLLRVSRTVVKGALLDGNRSLPGRLTAAVLASRLHANHPLTRLARSCTWALGLLAHFQQLRNRGQHFSAAPPSFDEADKDLARLFDLLRALVGVGPADAPMPAGVRVAGADLLLRIRAQAEQRVRNQYPGSDERPELHTRLIEWEHSAIVLEKLIEAEEVGVDVMRNRLRDFVVAAAVAMEALLDEIHTAAGDHRSVLHDALGLDRNRNATYIAELAGTLGFALDEKGALPAALTHARVERIRRAAAGGNETLSARMVALLLMAEADPVHPLRAVATLCPNLALHLGYLVEVRGHADQVVIEPGAALELHERQVAVLGLALEALDGAMVSA
jgi:hypothetical protein